MSDSRRGQLYPWLRRSESFLAESLGRPGDVHDASDRSIAVRRGNDDVVASLKGGPGGAMARCVDFDNGGTCDERQRVEEVANLADDPAATLLQIVDPIVAGISPALIRYVAVTGASSWLAANSRPCTSNGEKRRLKPTARTRSDRTAVSSTSCSSLFVRASGSRRRHAYPPQGRVRLAAHATRGAC